MKKVISTLLVFVLSITVLTGCTDLSDNDDTVFETTSELGDSGFTDPAETGETDPEEEETGEEGGN